MPNAGHLRLARLSLSPLRQRLPDQRDAVDQHFSERGRQGRLLTAFAASPGLLAIGLDEDTAVLIDGEGVLEVLGSEMVTIVDSRNTRSDYFEREIGEVLTIVISCLHVLAAGRRFDLNTRQLITDESEETDA